ncbi:MAG: S8 family serine peptidase [Pseudomonadota bacterium]
MTDKSFPDMSGPSETGDLLVLVDPEAKATASIKALESASGTKIAAATDFSGQGATAAQGLDDADGVFVERFGLAMIRGRSADARAELPGVLRRASAVQHVRPEYYMHATDTVRERYESWVRDGLRLLADGAGNALRAERMPEPEIDFSTDNVASTWGVRAVRADLSPYSGRGIKIAVLDTGFDFQHPDFVGRNLYGESFVPGETAQDLDGHGTHCAGTAAGPLAHDQAPRYGVAPEADLVILKVLGNNGGRENWVIAGMQRAIDLNCEVLSMSLGRRVGIGEDPDPVYERIGQIALASGSLIVAAAGNDSRRHRGIVAPVNAPANAPSIIAVGAIDDRGRIANFSNGGLNDDGGEVNFCAPGVDIASAYPMPRRYENLNGTSMATPHVAGVAALYAEADPSLRGRRLWEVLRRRAADIGVPIRAGGAGLVQAPVSFGSSRHVA